MIYKVFSLIKDRHFKTYRNQIQNYLIDNDLKLIQTLKPKKEDWTKSPFEKPSSIEVSFVQIKVLGIMVDPSNKEYKIILTSDKNGTQVKIWMEVNTGILYKTKIEFKKEL